MLGWERDVSSSITWERTGSFGRGLEGLGRMESFALQGGVSKSGVPPWDCSIFWVSRDCKSWPEVPALFPLEEGSFQD